MRFRGSDVNGGLWPIGEYEAVVDTAVEKISKQGNEMIELSLTCYNGGKMKTVWHFLLPLFGTFGQFCDAIGKPLPEPEQEAELTADECIGRNVRVVLGIKKQNGYPDKNTVTAFAKSLGAVTNRPATEADEFDPFAE